MRHYLTADSKEELTHEVAERALRSSDRELSYDRGTSYSVPLIDPVYSHDHNWSNNWVPSNCIKHIRSAVTIGIGVSQVAEMVVAEFEEVSGEKMDDEAIVGVYRIVSGRWGVGAVGEEYHKKMLVDDGANIVPTTGGDDVKYKVDVESDRGKDQVKLADSKRSDWTGSAPGKATRTVWVKPGDTWESEVVAEE